MIKKIKNIIEAIIAKTLFIFFSILPFSLSSNIGSFLARKIGPLLSINKIARKNIKIAFPDYDQNKINNIIYNMWDNVGRVIGEFPHIGKMDEKLFNKVVEVEGDDEELDKLIENGCIFVSAHISNWEIAAKANYMIGKPCDIVYRKANNKYVEKIINKNRSKYCNSMIRKGAKDSFKLIKSLKGKKHLAMLVDQKMNEGIDVPLFGISSKTAPAVASLALKYNRPIVPMRVIRINKSKFKYELSKPLYLEKTSDKEKDIYNIMLKINKIFEKWITQYPEQWLWLHRRWDKKLYSKM